MKRLYSYLLWMVAVIASVATAEAKTVTITIDNPSAAEYRDPFNNYEVGAWDAANSAVFTFDNDTYIPIVAVQNFEIVSAVSDAGVTLLSSSTSSFSVDTSALTDGATVTVTTAEKQPKVLKIIGNPDQIYVIDDVYQTHYASDFVDGVLTVNYQSEWGSVAINSVSGCKLISVKDEGGNEMLGYSPADYLYVSASSLPSGTTTLTVESKSEDELYDSRVTVNLDGPSYQVSMRMNGRSESVSLNEGANTVAFDSGSSLPFIIQHAYNSPYNLQRLYKVTLNGNEMTDVDGVYTLATVSDGDVINISVNPPAVDVNVSVSFADEDSKAALTSLRCDGDLIDPAVYGSFTTQTGKTLSFSFDYNNYDITMTENGVPVSVNYGSYNCKLMNESGYTYHITATPKQPLAITVICENWEHLNISNSYNGENPYALTGIETGLTILPANTYIYISATPGWVVRSVSNAETGEAYGTSFNVVDGMQIFVEVEEFKRDKSFVLYTEPDVWNYLTMTLSSQNYQTRYEFTPAPGYSTVAYCDADRPFLVSGYDNSYGSPTVYLNGVMCENSYGTFPALAEVADGDVIKIMSPSAQAHAVTYDVADGVDISVRHDFNLAADPAQPHEVFAGTEIHIIPAEGLLITVSANGTDIAADAEGKFVHTVTAPVDFSVALAPSGVTSAGIDTTGVADVYNLQGILVMRAATESQLRQLPAGIYIRDGKKVCVK